MAHTVGDGLESVCKVDLERVQVTVGPHEIDLLEAEVTAIAHARATSELATALVFDTILDVLPRQIFDHDELP
jgi:hypothetical protein